MKNFRLYTSNRMEVLIERLMDVLKIPPASPFDPEIIVVQSKGMEKWISLEAAGTLGVCAHMTFPFPNAFVYDLFKRVFTDLPETDPYDPGIAVWRIMKQLSRGSNWLQSWNELRGYLDGASDLKRYQLALKIAGLFDQYIIFRPEMVLEWEAGKDGGWQADLFRKIFGGQSGKHRARLAREFIEKIEQGNAFQSPPPERISLFGVSYLPPFHLRIFEAASRVMDVNIFVMNPCREHWAYITSPKDEQRIEHRYQQKAGETVSKEDLHLDRGNDLLASMGEMGRDFFLLTAEYQAENDDTGFMAPSDSTLLAKIHSDILDLKQPRESGAEKCVIAEDDHSLSVHVCHGPLREMEILQNNLLAMFEADAELKPQDIIVMTPEIENAAPYIQAVFNIPPSDPRYIPFSIADRSALSEGGCVKTFLDIPRTIESRYSAGAVMAILETPAVYRKFGLEEADLDNIRGWVEKTEIRWGIDAGYRKKLGLPEIEENTWKSGLNRLLLGYALPLGGERLFNGVLPFDAIEGGDGRILGCLAEFAGQLFAHTEKLEGAKGIREWVKILTDLTDDLFQPDSSEESEIKTIRDVIRDLRNNPETAGFDGKIDIKGIQAYLNHRLGEHKQDFRFLTGGVTFCAMLPMRSIPFKIVCLTGMDSDSFPRKTSNPGFDLMAAAPKRGDRSPRKEDRYLFLEAILSARKRLYISYTGRSARENTEIPPSVLVDDLLDYIQNGFTVPDKKIIDDHIMTVHKLQAFNAAYFTGGPPEKRFSYSPENFAAARALTTGGERRPAFLSGPLSDPEPEYAAVSIQSLYQFFNNPSEYLLKQRLNIYFEKLEDAREDAEPLQLGGLESYLLSERISEAMIENTDSGRLYEINKAAGKLPHGAIGKYTFEKNQEGVSDLVNKVAPLIDPGGGRTVEIDVELSGFRITDGIRLLNSEMFICYRYATVKPKDRLWVWINHLLLNINSGDGIRSLMVGKDGAFYLNPVENPENILDSLLDLYWRGLKQPVPFFPESSWKYAETLMEKGKNKPPEVALTEAIKGWKGDDYNNKPGERDDPYIDICFKHRDPLNDEFKNIAEIVYGPLIEAQEEAKL